MLPGLVVGMLTPATDLLGGEIMGLTLDEEQRVHLDRGRSGVAHEFEHLPTDEVDRRFEAIAQQLLSDATFADFIPVLSWRYTREALRTIEGIPAEFRPEPSDLPVPAVKG